MAAFSSARRRCACRDSAGSTRARPELAAGVACRYAAHQRLRARPATTYILLKQGVAGLNTNKVAARAGVNIASPYQYFPNKDALLVEIMRRHVRDTRKAILDTLVARRGGDNVRDTERALIDAMLKAHAVAPKLHAILTSEGARLQLDRIKTDVDGALIAEQKLWLAATPAKVEDAELTMWMAVTAAHSTIHTAFLERADDVQRPEFAEELTLLLTRFLERR
jgi:AcrR family transcriptional regulator